MSHLNRSRLTVELDGNWRLYTQTVPKDAQVLGTVTRGDQIGALAKLAATGNYVLISAGAISTLDQRKVIAALQAQQP